MVSDRASTIAILSTFQENWLLLVATAASILPLCVPVGLSFIDSWFVLHGQLSGLEEPGHRRVTCKGAGSYTQCLLFDEEGGVYLQMTLGIICN